MFIICTPSLLITTEYYIPIFTWANWLKKWNHLAKSTMDLKLPKIELNRSNNNNNRRTPERSDFNDEAVQATNDEAATAKL